VDEPRKTLDFALDQFPQQVEVVDLRQLVADSARQNDKRPAWITLNVPDEVVKTLRGRSAEGDLLLLVRIPKQVRERQGSRIILPGQGS
jgi:hypothetical protein